MKAKGEMATMSDFRRVADDVRNWGRWGDADELGTLNFITADKIPQAASLVKHGKVFPLGVDFGSSGPQGAFHFRQNPLHMMTIDGGDASTWLEYGPKWLTEPRSRTAQRILGERPDAVQRRRDHHAAAGRHPVGRVVPRLLRGLSLQRLPCELGDQHGRYHCGIDKVDSKGITSRGVLLDIVRLRGVETFCELGQPITPDELDEAARSQGVTIGRGDIVLVRTGWWARFLETGNGGEPGRRPGLDVRVVAARPRGGGGCRRQPDGREPGVGHRRRLPAHAHAVPPRYGSDARRVLGPEGAGRRLRRRRCLRIPAHRAAAAGDRRGRITGESHCNQVGVNDDHKHHNWRRPARRRPRRNAEGQLVDRTGLAVLSGIRRTTGRTHQVVRRPGPRPADVRATRAGTHAQGARVGQRAARRRRRRRRFARVPRRDLRTGQERAGLHRGSSRGSRVYLDNTPWGCISCAYGWQAAVGTLGQLRAWACVACLAHAARRRDQLGRQDLGRLRRDVDDGGAGANSRCWRPRCSTFARAAWETA